MSFLATDNQLKESNPLKFPFSMSSDGNDDVAIPSLFIEREVADILISLMGKGKQVVVLLTWATEELINQLSTPKNEEGSVPPTPEGPTQAPSATESQSSKLAKQDSSSTRREDLTKVGSTRNRRQGLQVEEEEDESADCSANDGLFDSGRKDGQHEHAESSADDVQR